MVTMVELLGIHAHIMYCGLNKLVVVQLYSPSVGSACM